jgi:hypothetical protein
MTAWHYRIVAILFSLTMLLGSAPSPAAAEPFVLSSLTVDPAIVTGGARVVLAVTMTGDPPWYNKDPQPVWLNSSHPAVVNVSTMWLPPSYRTASISFLPHPVAESTTVTITGHFTNDSGGTYMYKAVTLTVVPPVPASLALSPASVTGSAPSTGTVALSGPAPAGGLVVGLFSNKTAAATVQKSVTVPAGATTAPFTITTNPVSSAASVSISASVANITKIAALWVLPPRAAQPQPQPVQPRPMR